MLYLSVLSWMGAFLETLPQILIKLYVFNTDLTSLASTIHVDQFNESTTKSSFEMIDTLGKLPLFDRLNLGTSLLSLISASISYTTYYKHTKAFYNYNEEHGYDSKYEFNFFSTFLLAFINFLFLSSRILSLFVLIVFKLDAAIILLYVHLSVYLIFDLPERPPLFVRENNGRLNEQVKNILTTMVKSSMIFGNTFIFIRQNFSQTRYYYERYYITIGLEYFVIFFVFIRNSSNKDKILFDFIFYYSVVGYILAILFQIAYYKCCHPNSRQDNKEKANCNNKDDSSDKMLEKV